MRLDDYRTSDNVEDQGQGSGGGGMGFGGGGGGIFGLLFGIVASRFGIVGIIVLALGAMLFGMNPLSMITGGSPTTQAPRTTGQSAAQICTADPAKKFSCQVLASTEDTWTKLFADGKQRYTPADLVFYGGSGQSGCGAAQSAMGPFYCPTDKKVYLDTAFYSELQQRFGAPGDFAQAYVIAHEIGHHVQDLTGTLDQARQAQQATSQTGGNAVQVKVELQADCYAGVWAARNPNLMSPGDTEEGLRAAGAIGDDTLQRESQGRVSPESFTHGTAAQRQFWLKKGLTTGDPAQCDTFAAGADA